MMLPKPSIEGQGGESIGLQGDMDRMEPAYGSFETSRKPSTRTARRRTMRSSKIRPSKWMSALDDDTLLSAITIPGTHDSAAYTVSWPFVATQKLSIVQQLDAGIRYFDFRCGVRNDIVEMVHGEAYLGLTLSNVLNAMYEWLAAHPSEALIAQIKRDRKEQKSAVDFAHAVSQVLARRSELWRTANTTPTISDLRGRIQLFRRFDGPSLYAYGIDVSEWQDNPLRPFTICTLSGVQLTIQDHYAFPEPTSLPDVITTKGGDVRGLLERADHDKNNKNWYLNFTSAYEVNIVYQIPPRQIAVGGYWFFRWKHGLNIRLRQYLKELPTQKRRFGVMAMDFPEQGAEDLITALFMTNFERGTAGSRLLRVVLIVILTAAVLLLGLIMYAIVIVDGHLLTGRPGTQS